MEKEIQDMCKIQIERLDSAGIKLSSKLQENYLNSPDILLEDTDTIPLGYKRCGRCKQIKKFYLFNRNLSTKTNCTGNCKECQAATAKKSYKKNKHKRDYKEYYRTHQEEKREHGRKYYEKNKEQVLEKQKAYRQTDAGRQIMNSAHNKRKKLLRKNAGIPYTREMVIDRDSKFIGNELPICCLCNTLIEDLSTMHMEHLISVGIGGPDCFTNVGCAHKECNLGKSKDGREITVEQVDTLVNRAEAYIEANPALFPDF